MLQTMYRMFALSALILAGVLGQGCGDSDEAATDQEIEDSVNKLDEALNKRGEECCGHGMTALSWACLSVKSKKAVSSVNQCADAVASMPCADLPGTKPYPNPCPEVCEIEVRCTDM